ncbi:hypothetical protein ACP275_05G014100 [Erythranthe tilingii]
MISLFHACCSTILSRTGCLVTKRPPTGHFYPSCNTSCKFPGVRTVDLELLLTRLGVRHYCSKKSGGSGGRKPKAGPKSQMKNDKEAFFVVRKGDLVGVYKSLKDCQAQVGTSICDPPVSVYKGSSMSKETEKYLVSSGLKNALYSIRASDLTEDLFGTLVACPVQLPSVKIETSNEPVSKKRSHDAVCSDYEQRFCTLEFDGASKGNPGQAGAGAILRSVDGSFVCRMREGLGIATCNVAEYRAFILGLKYALRKGFTSVQVRGDSKLVCMQIEGLWKVRNPNIATWYEEAKNLKDRFVNFEITHVLRDLNCEADVQANLGVDLPEGHVQEEIDK